MTKEVSVRLVGQTETRLNRIRDEDNLEKVSGCV